MQLSAYVAVSLFSGVILIGLTVYVGRFGDRPGVGYLRMSVLSAGVYSLGYAGQLAGTTTNGKLLWHLLQLPPYLAIAPFMFLFALEYSGNDTFDRRTVLVLLAIEPIFLLAIALTHQYHGLYASRVTTTTSAGLVWLQMPAGPVLWFDRLYQAGLFVAVIGVFVHLFVTASSLYRNQATIMIASVGVPLVASFGNRILRLTSIDVTPLFLAFTGVGITLGVFRAQLMDVVPIDWTGTLDEVRAGIFVVDDRGRFVEANAGARDLFGVDDTPAGASATVVLEERLGVTLSDLDDGGEFERDVEEGGDGTHYEVRRSGITGPDGSTRGELVSLYDVTDLRELEHELRQQNQQLTVLNRLLRHDIRNDVAVALGRAELLEEHVDSPVAEDHLDPIISACRHVRELTEVSRDLAEAVSGEESIELRPTSVAASLQRTIERAQTRYPDATFDAPETIPDVEVEATELLDSVFTNLLNNAVQHTREDHPRVEVTANEDDGIVRVSVADQGPGIPDERKEAIFGRGEKGIESSGSGLGLYLVGSIVDEYGGRVWVEDNDPRGAVFTVTLPIA